MKNIHEKFSSIDLLHYLYSKLGFLFQSQQYIITILQETLKRPRMVAILGREGLGKSSGIAKFVHENKNVFYLRIGTTYRISDFFNEMLFQVTGVYPSIHQPLFTKMKMLSHALTKDNSKKLIIIDDAGRLSPRALSVFFELYDNSIQCTGFAFVGLDYFQKNLLKAKAKGVPGIAEFVRRVSNFYSVPGLLANEIVSYGIAHKLNEDQVLQLKRVRPETIAELENMTRAILEEAEDAAREDRTPKQVNVPARANPDPHEEVKRLSKGQRKGIDFVNDEQEREDDQVEEDIVQKKREAARKARAAKKSQQKMINGHNGKTTTRHEPSV